MAEISTEELSKLITDVAVNVARSMTKQVKIVNFLGKEYLRQSEAAEYIGAGEDKFREFVKDNGIPSKYIAGTKKYRVSDLKRAVESEWRS